MSLTAWTKWQKNEVFTIRFVKELSCKIVSMFSDLSDWIATHRSTIINNENQVFVFQITLVLLFKKLCIHQQLDVQHRFVIFNNFVLNLSCETFHESVITSLVFFDHML
jgi:hypothetical protein